MEKVLFVDSISLLKFGDSTNIPTAISYAKECQPAIGFEAYGLVNENGVVNQEYKIALGEIRPGKGVNARRRFDSGDEVRRSAYEISKDYFEVLIRQSKMSLEQNSLEMASQVMISEPLSFFQYDNEDWLPNYRGNIKRILGGEFETIDYMPEPFAVYQYYRYGKKHPLVTDSKKIYALVVDFGGGTFDVSIVETTNSGDISLSGRHARPLGANSKPFGGYAINRIIAKKILTDSLTTAAEKERYFKAFKLFERVNSGEQDEADLNHANKSFIKWYRKFLQEIEGLKISLMKSINSWGLDAKIQGYVQIEIPENPFEENTEYLTYRLEAIAFRKIYIEDIWPRQLKGIIKNTLKYSEKEIGKSRIHAVLLSGGSSNIRWLEELLKRDFENELIDADIARLHDDYQEVVAKGLAIECARRGYEEKSEFTDVTYNPLYIVVNPDGRGDQRKKYKLIDGVDPENIKDMVDCQLLSSAIQLDGDNGESKMRWRVRLDFPPKQYLDYYFLRNPSDIDDLESRYNFLESRVHTKLDKFDQNIKLDLTFRSDGTCKPHFIYRTGENKSILNDAAGQPFYMDSVLAHQGDRRSAYIGIDFGTSTSAVSYIDWKHVEKLQKRKMQPEWLKLHELLDLPYPVSAPIKNLLAQSDSQQVLSTLDLLESLMAFLVTIGWADLTASRPDKKSRLFGANYQRSAGQLKACLVQLVSDKGSSLIVKRIKDGLKDVSEKTLGEAVDQLNHEKHQKKLAGTFDAMPLIEILANAVKSALVGYEFGYFENVKRQSFGDTHTGFFRAANGHQPYHEKYDYSGPYSFGEQQAFLISPESGEALELTPLLYWDHVQRHGATQIDCYMFDGANREGLAEFKQCEYTNCQPHSEGALLEIILSLQKGEYSAQKYENITFKKISA